MFDTLTIQGKEFYLVPKEMMDKFLGDNAPVIAEADPVVETPKPEPETSFLNDFLSNPPAEDQPAIITPSHVPTDDQDGGIAEAEGKPSDYRNRFVSHQLSSQDVIKPNTANLSSLRRRQSTFDEKGKEVNFDEVSL